MLSHRTPKDREKSNVVADGEYIGFDLAFCDSAAPSGRIFLMDSEQNRDAKIIAQVDVEHAIHDAKFQFLGDTAPSFDRDKALFLARSAASQDTARALHDAALRNRNAPAGVQFAASPAISVGTGGTAEIHDAARRARRA